MPTPVNCLAPELASLLVMLSVAAGAALETLNLKRALFLSMLFCEIIFLLLGFLLLHYPPPCTWRRYSTFPSPCFMISWEYLDEIEI